MVIGCRCSFEKDTWPDGLWKVVVDEGIGLEC
jgi:hypothetical protein